MHAVLAQVCLSASATEEALKDQLGGTTWPVDVSQPLPLATSVLAQWAHEWRSLAGRMEVTGTQQPDSVSPRLTWTLPLLPNVLSSSTRGHC